MKANIFRFRCSDRYVAVVTTVGNRRDALHMAGRLVKGRFAACVQMWPIVSIYHWKGRVCRSSEYLLLAKASVSCARSVCAEILKLHTYELPEIIVLPIRGGYGRYLEWLESERVLSSSNKKAKL